MEFIADLLLAAGAFGAGSYCLVLSRRLTRFNDLEGGMGGAVAVLSVQVEDLKAALEQAKATAAEAAADLQAASDRAEELVRRLELGVAANDRKEGCPEDRIPPAASGRQVRRRRRTIDTDAMDTAA